MTLANFRVNEQQRAEGTSVEEQRAYYLVQASLNMSIDGADNTNERGMHCAVLEDEVERELTDKVTMKIILDMVCCSPVSPRYKNSKTTSACIKGARA